MNKLVEGQFVQIEDAKDKTRFLNCFVKDVFDDFVVIRSDSNNHRLMLSALDDKVKDGALVIPTVDGEPVMVKKAWGEYTFTPNKKKKRGLFGWKKN